MIARLGAVVLAGGRSSRMGSDKASLVVDGEPLLVRTSRVVARVASPIVIVAREGQALPFVADARVVVDRAPDRGPLEGVAVGLAALEGFAERAFVASVDLPCLCVELVARLAALLDDAGAVVPRVEGRAHPLAAVWRIDARATIDARIARGELRVLDAIDAIGGRFVDEHELLADPDLARIDPTLASLENANSPDDLARALARLRA